MPDMDVIVKSLRRCSDMTECPDDCSYKMYAPDCVERLHRDAIALLKEQNELLKQQAELLEEQEAVEPINSYGTFRCGNCKNIVGYNDGHGRGYQNNFCSKCGRPVKWNG